MWWKLLLAGLSGTVVGGCLVFYVFYLTHDASRDIRLVHFAKEWSSAGREWKPFAEWLRRGGRKFKYDIAVHSAKNGMNEDEIRTVFGPPDLVIGVDKLSSEFSAIYMHGLGATSAYLYKLGGFAFYDPRKPASQDLAINHEAFAVLFNSAGKVVYRTSVSLRPDDELAVIDADTRTDDRITK